MSATKARVFTKLKLIQFCVYSEINLDEIRKPQSGNAKVHYFSTC